MSRVGPHLDVRHSLWSVVVLLQLLLVKGSTTVVPVQFKHHPASTTSQVGHFRSAHDKSVVKVVVVAVPLKC